MQWVDLFSREQIVQSADRVPCKPIAQDLTHEHLVIAHLIVLRGATAQA